MRDFWLFVLFQWSWHTKVFWFCASMKSAHAITVLTAVHNNEIISLEMKEHFEQFKFYYVYISLVITETTSKYWTDLNVKRWVSSLTAALMMHVWKRSGEVECCVYWPVIGQLKLHSWFAARWRIHCSTIALTWKMGVSIAESSRSSSASRMEPLF